ncbi:type 4b pilus protein PilO2 [bacterium]|nr:type 4b pilus protein PilO2 [bacterium]
MANQVITVDRKKYATGLFWQPVASGFVARTYARSLAHSVDGKLNLYTDYRAMVGLGSRRVGHHSGMHSAAAEIMDSMTEYSSFLGVFQTGNLFYLVAVRNGIILQDRLFDSEVAARNEYMRLATIPDWAALFAPSSWGAPRAVERSLSDIITGRAPAALRNISMFRVGMAQIAIIALFLLFGVYLFRGPIAQMMSPRPQVSTINPELAAEYKRQIEEKNKELDAAFDIKKVTPPEPLSMPYDNLPNPMTRAQLCYRAIGFLMQPISGWNQTSVECGEEYAVAKLRRDFGTLADFYNVAGDLMPGVFVTENSENALSVRATLPAMDMVASRDERDAATIVRDVYSLFQSIDDDVQIGVVTDNVTNGVESVYLDVVEIAASSKLIPQQFMEIFQEFGGVYMTRCEWDATRRIWNYEVIIYAK